MTLRIEELDSPWNLRILRAAFWAIAILAGFLQVWAARFAVTPDGTCYLDIASAYLRGDWHNALNSYWSPFLSWLLALAMGILHPGPYWESTLLHFVNFAGFLFALVCFEFFFRSLLRHSKEFASSVDAEPALPEFGWWLLGYGLFLSTTLSLLPATYTTPDIWVSAFTYIVAGLILRIHISGGGWRLFALLGFTLALAYLTKTFYFPMSFVFLLAGWMAAGNLRRTARQAALGLILSLAVAGPWIFVLSRSRQRFTFGDVGKLAFAITVDQIPQLFWQGENGSGVPTHPVRQLLAHPHIFEFASPIGGTYPPAFDGSYWLDGVRVRLNVHGQLAVLRQSFGTFFQIWQIQLEYAVLLLALFFAAASRPAWWKLFRQQAFILAAVCVTGLKAAKFAVSDVLAMRSSRENVDWQVAQALRAAGLQPGDSVAGLSRVAESHWARLAGVKIVAEIPLGDEDVFWESSPEAKQKVFRILAGTGAKMVVTKYAPPSAVNEGWIPLGDTSFYVHRLAAVASANATDRNP